MNDNDIKEIIAILTKEGFAGGDIANETSGRFIRELQVMREQSQKWLSHRAAEWQKKRKKRRK